MQEKQERSSSPWAGSASGWLPLVRRRKGRGCVISICGAVLQVTEHRWAAEVFYEGLVPLSSWQTQGDKTSYVFKGALPATSHLLQHVQLLGAAGDTHSLKQAGYQSAAVAFTSHRLWFLSCEPFLCTSPPFSPQSQWTWLLLQPFPSAWAVPWYL